MKKEEDTGIIIFIVTWFCGLLPLFAGSNNLNILCLICLGCVLVYIFSIIGKGGKVGGGWLFIFTILFFIYLSAVLGLSTNGLSKADRM